MKSYIFQITPDSVKLLCKINSKTKITFMPLNIEIVRVNAENMLDATDGAKAIQQARLDYMEKIRADPIQIIGQLG